MVKPSFHSPIEEEKSISLRVPVRIGRDVVEYTSAIRNSSASALRINSENGSPSRVLIGPTPRHMISLPAPFSEANAYFLTVQFPQRHYIIGGD
jgi:hypothetical protein